MRIVDSCHGRSICKGERESESERETERREREREKEREREGTAGWGGGVRERGRVCSERKVEGVGEGRRS
jgi:hypothetical protein